MLSTGLTVKIPQSAPLPEQSPAPSSPATTGAEHAPLPEPVGLRGWEGPLDAPIEWATEPLKDKRGSWGPMHSWVEFLGDKEENHWAVGGCLHKLGRVLGSDAAREYQLQRRHRGLKDAVDQLLKKNDRIDTYNAGHCNQAAMRVAFFPNPKKDVTRHIPRDGARRSRFYALQDVPPAWSLVQDAQNRASDAASWLGQVPGLGWAGDAIQMAAQEVFEEASVTFTKRDIELLMNLCMDDHVDPTQGYEGFEYVGYRYTGPAPEGQLPLENTDPLEPYPHQVINWVAKGWGQERKLPIFADIDPGVDVKNRLFDGGRVEHLRTPPSDFDVSKVPPGGTVKYHRVQFTCDAEHDYDIDLDAWIHTAPDGLMTSHWIQDAAPDSPRAKLPKPKRDRPRSPNADFYWTTFLKPEILAGAPWIGFADKINPHVDAFYVWSLYAESRGQNWVEIANRHPERVAEHFRIVDQHDAHLGQARRPYIDRMRVALALGAPDGI